MTPRNAAAEEEGPATIQLVEFAGSRLALVPEGSVTGNLSLAEALADLRQALAFPEDEGGASFPRVRVTSRRPDRAWLHTLRARLDPWGVLGGKDYTSMGFTTPSMWVTVARTETGLPVALIEARYLSLVRTAAVTALATDLLAPAEPACLAHFGAGQISELLVRAMLHVRPSLRTVLVVRGHPDRGAPAWLADLGPGVEARLAGPEEAVGEADLATTATSSKEPVIPAGAATPRLHHLNLVGSNHLKRREIGRDLALRCLPPGGFLVADDPEQAALEAGDFRPLVEEGRLRWDEVPSLAELVRRADLRERGRRAGLTAFKSVGIGLMDLIVASGVLRRLGVLAPQETPR